MRDSAVDRGNKFKFIRSTNGAGSHLPCFFINFLFRNQPLKRRINVIERLSYIGLNSFIYLFRDLIYVQLDN